MFRASAVALGGGRHFLVPKSVFSFAGGFWGSASAGGDEKRSSLIAVGVLASALAVTYSVSVERMVRRGGDGAQRAAPGRQGQGLGRGGGGARAPGFRAPRMPRRREAGSGAREAACAGAHLCGPPLPPL